MKYNAILERQPQKNNQTIGQLRMFNDNEFIFSCVTLELGWHDNKRMISCIPAGVYDVNKYSSEKYPNVYEVQNVEDRSKILFHWGNYGKDTNGCILLGKDVTDINKDNVNDITNSKNTVAKMKELINYNNFSLIIV